ncbi:MAG: GAF domain-containing protein, partial [Anaerolineae bacterium]
MEQESVWVVDPDPAFRTKAEEALREAGLEVTSLGEVGREPPWQEGDTVIAAVELLPVGGAPGTLVALVPPGDGAAQVKALQDGACWCMYRDPACLPQLPAILREVWAEEGLLAERQIYYRALEQMDEGVVVEDGEGYLTFVSPRALKMLGYEPGELEGRHYGEIVHPSDQGSAEAETHKRPRGIASQYECRLLHKDGSVIPAWVAATPLFEGEQFTGVIVTLRDISREKNLQERFSVLQQVAIAVGEASELGEILRRARRALGVLMEGVRDVVFAIADEDGEVLRPLIPQPGYPLVNLLVEALNKPLPRIQVPISRLPVEWRERIPQGQPCLSLDVLDLTRRMFGPEVAEAAARQGGVRSVAALPMRSGGMLRGMIFVTLERRHVYESDLDLGMVVANLVTAALENQSLLERVRHRMYNLDRLFELSQAMTASMEPVDLADVALRQFIQALDVDKARISLWDEQRNVLKSMLDVSCDQRSGDFRSQRVERVTLLDDSPSTQKVMESRQPLQIPLSDPEIDSHGPPLVWEKDIQMLVILPLLYKGECIGIVELGNSSNERRLASDQMNLAMTLAGQVAVAFENARLLKEARRRAVQLSTAAEVARHATGILDSETLLEQTVDLIRERFGFYYAAIFLLDGEGEQAILRAATGEAGEKMLEKDYALPVGAGSIVGHVAAEGEPWISNDVESDPRYLPDSLLPETRCELGLPLQVRGQVIGVLDVQSTQIAGFSSDDVATLQTLADQVAGAIENARLHEAQRRRLNELSGLYEISRAITAVLDLRDLVEVVNQQVSRFADVPIFYIALWERETDTIRLPVIVEEDQRLYDQEVDWEGLVGWVLRHGEPLLTADLSEEESIPADVKPIFVGPSHPRSVLIVPLTVGDRIIGVLSVQSEKVGIYNQDDLDFLSAVASQVAIAVDNARLFEEARIHAEELAALNELGQALTAHLDAEEVLGQAYHGASRLLDTNNLYVALYDPEREEVTFPLYVTEREVEWPYETRRAANGLTEYI